MRRRVQGTGGGGDQARQPCGVAVAQDQFTAYRRAYECDPVSIFGGIVAVNTTLEGRTGRWSWPNSSSRW
jgi:hypothetical protein